MRRSVARVLAREWPVLAPYALLLAILHAWFAPGLIAGEDFHAPPFTSLTTLAHAWIWPPSIEPLYDLGANMQPWSPSFPIWMLVGVLFRLGVSWNVLERLFWLWPFFVLAVGLPYWFFRRRGIVPAAAAVGATLFAVNTWTIGLIERGHFPALIAYALIPAVVDRFIAVVEDAKRTAPAEFALLVTLQTMYEVRYTYLTVLLCALLTLLTWSVRRRRLGVRPLLTRIGIGAGLALALNVYWILPAAMAPPNLDNETNLAAFMQISGSMTLWHALALSYPEYHHNAVVAPFVAEPVERWLFLLPVIAAAGYYFGRRRRYAWIIFAAGVAVIVVLGGPNSPLGFVSIFVYSHLPGFKLFRDITKLFSMVGFAMSYGVALACNHGLAVARPFLRRALRPALTVAAVFVLGILMRDAFNPLRDSNFNTTTLRPQDRALQRFIASAPGDGDVILFPSDFPGVQPTQEHPILSAGNMALSAAPAGLIALVPQQQISIFSLFRSPLARRILTQIGVEYVIVVDDPETFLYRPWMYGIEREESLRLLGALPWLERTRTIGSDVVFRIRGSQPRRPAFYATCPLAVVGDERALASIPSSSVGRGEIGFALAAQQERGVDLSPIPNLFVADVDRNALDPLSALRDGIAPTTTRPRYVAFPATDTAGVRFLPGGVMTNVDGVGSARAYLFASGTTIAVQASIAKGSTRGSAAIYLGDRADGYGIEYDGNGNVHLRAYTGGAVTNLGRIGGPYANDTRFHTLRLRIVAGGSSNAVDGSWDGIDPNAGSAIVDSSLHLAGTWWKVTLYTGGAAGRAMRLRVTGTGPSNPFLRSTLHRSAPACVPSSGSFTRRNDAEVEGATLAAAGLLVQNAAYDDGWQLAMLPSGAVPSGNAAIDYLRFRGDVVPRPFHYIVDGDLNGWWTQGGDRRVLAIFTPTATAGIGALAELPALLLFGLVMWRRR